MLRSGPSDADGVRPEDAETGAVVHKDEDADADADLTQPEGDVVRSTIWVSKRMTTTNTAISSPSLHATSTKSSARKRRRKTSWAGQDEPARTNTKEKSASLEEIRTNL